MPCAVVRPRDAGQVQAAAEYYPLPVRYDDFDKSERAPAYLKGARD